MLPEPLSQFCRKSDGSWDYHEWHSILIGIGDGLQPWRPDNVSCEPEHHYYIVARGATTFIGLTLLLVIGAAAWKRCHKRH